MRTIGIDIGTTTLSIVLLEPVTGKVVEVKTIPNTGVMESTISFEKIQDPEEILRLCKGLLQEMAGTDSFEQVKGIGVTGQMHGILYLNAKGDAVSPLYTWQDARGNQLLPEDKSGQQGLSYAGYAQQETGYFLASGFGGVTHYYNAVNGLVPKEATCFCTIADYIGMKLSGRSKPLLHPSMAASLGLYDLREKCFDQEAIEKLGLDFTFFPEIHSGECWIGSTEDGIPVSVALGDNQASFLGATRGVTHPSKGIKTQRGASTESSSRSILLNIGTGSQISIYSESLGAAKGGEYRPYLRDSFIWAGSPLCGGYSYHLLKNFFEKALELFGATPTVDLYQAMNQAGECLYNECSVAGLGGDDKQRDEKQRHSLRTDTFQVDTRFKGTRTDPKRLGSFLHIAEENLQPDHFVLGFLKGIAGELYEFYQDFLLSDTSSTDTSSTDTSSIEATSTDVPSVAPSMTLIGSGNGLRKNPLLRRICSELFGEEMLLSSLPEEAACGSAFLAGELCKEEEMSL